MAPQGGLDDVQVAADGILLFVCFFFWGGEGCLGSMAFALFLLPGVYRSFTGIMRTPKWVFYGS